jgi:diguanylate cyclase (GGDEF)-like protein
VSEYTSIIDSVRWLVLTAALLMCIVYLYMAKSIQPVLKGVEERNKQLQDELQNVRGQLDHMANVDFLTDCLNLNGLEHIFAIEQNRTMRVGATLVAVLINVDNFRRMNDDFGFAVGDEILKEVAKRIMGILRPSDRLARVGPDEFLVLLTDTQLAYGMRVAERVRVQMSEAPLRAGNDIVPVTVSIGVAPLPPKLESVEEILQLTRSAMKRSKSGGRNRVSLAREKGTPEEEAPAMRNIVEVLCDGGHFRAVYQPIVELATQDISAYEIYTRGPDGAFESPAEFFRVCVENNILTSTDILCLKLAIASVSDLRTSVRFHINVFPSTLLDTQIENLISLFPKDKPGKFCIELSEQQFVGDPAHLREHVIALRQAGILVAIDDIGFGRSSLESLILLEPDIVKVDRKYVTGVAHDASKQRLLKRVVNVGRSLGAEVVAEGIEGKEDLPVLQEIGVQYGQGYYWGPLMEVLPSDVVVRTAIKSER